MEFPFKLEPRDFRAFTKNARVYSQRLKKVRLGLYFLLVVATFFIHFQSSNLTDTFIQTLVFAGVVFPVLERLAFYVRDRFFFHKALLKTRHAIINEKGMTFHSDTQQQFYLWEHFDQAIEDDSYFYLYGKDGKGTIIPKRELEYETATEFREFLQTHVDSLKHDEPSPIRIVIPALQAALLIMVLSFFFI
ncbi:YcxB family protein [Sediminibacillus sp. JSM 1682029]|uniref:YcxB family protein n=1 Tax=Sediminibacillus sp. JSM 1682029 TaxID=3229857 RepID=UPI00352346CC